MAITDNRTSITANNTNANIDDATGAANGNTNTETFVEGTGSVSVKVSSATDALLYDAGSAQNWSNNHFYIWWNVSTAGKLDSLANGGVRVRFCGATVTDYFEVYIAGNDTYTGGFEMAVVDIETARANAIAGTLGGTGGTTPATSAIRYVGMFFDVTAMISGNVDNCFIDAMWRLPQNTPGIIVDQQNTGSVDWTWQDIVDAGDIGDTTKAWGSIRKENGVIFVNTPIRFGANDANTHGFSDENVVVAWEDKLVASDFYGLTVIGGTGTQSFQAGLKTGTGDDAVGTQGWVILAEATGERWFFDADDANIDACNLYGCTLIHSGDLQLDNSNNEIISNTILDGTSARLDNCLFLKNNVINANTADGVAWGTIDDMTDIRRCTFIFSDGHALELTTPRVATQTSKGNIFTGYGSTGTNDAAVYNNTAGAVTINVTDNGGSITYRNGTSASTTVNISVDLEINGLTEGSYGVMIGSGGAEDGNTLLSGYADSTGTIAGTFSGTTPQNVSVKARNAGIINAAIQDDGGVFTDYSEEARDTTGGVGSANDVPLLPATPAVSDAFYFGGLAEFGKLTMDISTAGATYVGTWEYWNGAWTALTVTDDTSSFQTAGWNDVTFTPPSDWSTTTINSQGPFYYVRFRVTTGGGTQPFAETISLNDTVKYLPFNSTGTIATGTGLTSTAVWLEDTNNP